MRWLCACVLIAACGGAPQPAPAGFDDFDDAPSVQTEPAERQRAQPAPRIEGPARVAPAPRRRGVRFRGRRIDLDVKDADLTNLFRFLAEVGGINVVIAPDVRGAITLRLRSVPWDQIAYVVARAHKLEIERDGRLWLIRKATP